MQHRSTLKQQNKSFKSKHSTKGAAKRSQKGRVALASSISRKMNQMSKEARRQQKRQILTRHRQKILEARRQGTADHSPKIIALLALSEDARVLDIKAQLCAHATVAPQANGAADSIAHIRAENCDHQRMCLLPVPRTNDAVLDAAKVADVMLFALTPSGIDEFGSLAISLLAAQGCPSPVVVLQDLETLPAKRQAITRKELSRLCIDKFSETCKVITHWDPATALRVLANVRPKPIHWRAHRPYMLVDRSETAPDGQSVYIYGFLRSRALSANQLVHLTGIGDFPLKQIDLIKDPIAPFRKSREQAAAMSVDSEVVSVLQTASPDKRESLIREALPPESQEDEQTWPTDEEIAEADPVKNRLFSIRQEAEVRAAEQRVKQLPPGTSSYQAAWIPDDDDLSGEESGEEGEGEEETESGEMIMQGEEGEMDVAPHSLPTGMAPPASRPPHTHIRTLDDLGWEMPQGSMALDNDEDNESVQFSVSSMLLNRKPTKEERREEMTVRAREEMEFPDEVDVPLDIPARDRFVKYRGLKSFRNSLWDPKELLPKDYGRVFQFANFRRASKRAKLEVLPMDSANTNANAMDTVADTGETTEATHPARPGQYVRLHLDIAGVEIGAFVQALARPGFPLTCVGLLRYERKTSVVHFMLTKSLHYTDPVPSKEELVFHVGFRRLAARPVYSTYSMRDRPGSKAKAERFLMDGRLSVASIYGPVMFPNAPVLAFHPTTGALVASGELLGADPDRLVIKRVILTGYPIKIKKKHAVIRYMFFNPEDIRWFQPVELWTKHGRSGRIKESLGTHGYFKAIFDGHLASQDTVCMSLYRRVFPKWSTRDVSPIPQLEEARERAEIAFHAREVEERAARAESMQRDEGETEEMQ
eukprot:gnl/Trimastix_PCT/1155.p1 GENE.gnl/Trimastix_PCT/1155~~gnl/Trimastix_PCT/1155.p1  ORF type:complete len:877 (+),score=264.80 gnl/Trimastix_PCT/1155:36-2666(+)